MYDRQFTEQDYIFLQNIGFGISDDSLIKKSKSNREQVTEMKSYLHP